MINLKNKNTQFIIFWIAFQLFFNWLYHINLPPFGMHQGAQADRACIAFNYFSQSENFFLPRVMESRNYQGVTGMEFPIIQYVVSLLYQIFGFHHYLYRITVGFTFFLGCFSFWKITGLFLNSTLQRYALFIILFSSPILVFYSFNFIPDIPAFSFSLCAWYYFFKFYFSPENKKSLILYQLFVTLTGLIKVTFLIGHFTVIGILLLSFYFPIQNIQAIKLTFKQILGFIIPLIIVIAWYSYSSYLTKTTYNTHFLQQINPAKTVNEFFSNAFYSFKNWTNRIYLFPIFIAYLVTWIYSIFANFRKLNLIGYISIFLFLGFIMVFILFNYQFRYHDYYYISLFPFIFFGLLWIFSNNEFSLTSSSKSKKILSYTVIFILPVINSIHARNNVMRTFIPGKYYCQSIVFNIQDYNNVRRFLNVKYPNNHEVFCAFDESPNTCLYFLGRQGVRIAKNFDLEAAEDIFDRKYENNKIKFLPLIVINDIEAWRKLNLNKYKITQPIYKSGSLIVYGFIKIK